MRIDKYIYQEKNCWFFLYCSGCLTNEIFGFRNFFYYRLFWMIFSWLKGTVSWDGYFNHYFVCMRIDFQRFLTAFRYVIQIWFMKLFTCFFTWLMKPSSEFHSLYWSMSSASTPHWLQWKCKKLTCHKQLLAWLQVLRRLSACFYRAKIAAVESWRRFLKGFPKLVCNFIHASKYIANEFFRTLAVHAQRVFFVITAPLHPTRKYVVYSIKKTTQKYPRHKSYPDKCSAAIYKTVLLAPHPVPKNIRVHKYKYQTCIQPQSTQSSNGHFLAHIPSWW